MNRKQLFEDMTKLTRFLLTKPDYLRCTANRESDIYGGGFVDAMFWACADQREGWESSISWLSGRYALTETECHDLNTGYMDNAPHGLDGVNDLRLTAETCAVFVLAVYEYILDRSVFVACPDGD